CGGAPNQPDGTTCSDGNACTQSDTCQAGVCTPGSPVVCTAPDACHLAGSCNPVTGVCGGAPNQPDGTTCSDGNACTQSDTCQAGVCTPGSLVVCTAPDACHLVGIRNAVPSVCGGAPNQPDGTTCSDGNA